MTWYSYKAWQAVTAKQQQDEKHHSNYGYNYCHKIIDKNSNKVNVTLVVSNMRTDKDQQNIVNHLKKLPGIISVNVNLRRRWLILTYNTFLTNLEIITRNLNILGYNYIKKT